MNPYEILEVDKNTSLEDIKIKYKQLANKYHPDKGGDAEKFKLINLAYNILMDPIKRQSYDDNGIFFTDTTIINDAKTKLVELFNLFINPLDPENHDLIMIMSFELKRRDETNQKRIQDIKITIEKLLKVKNKLKLKKKTHNHMEELLEDTIQQCQRDLEHSLREEKVFAYTKIILDNYAYSDFEYFEKLPE